MNRLTILSVINLLYVILRISYAYGPMHMVMVGQYSSITW